MAEPWERLPGEREAAWKAFCIYRDMPAARTVLGAYRIYAEKPGAKQAGGGFSAWAKKYRWEERAASYSDHIDRARVQQATAEAVAQEINRAKDRKEFHSRLTRLCWKGAEKSEALYLLPVVDQHLSDGRTVIKAGHASEFRTASRIALEILELGVGLGLLELPKVDKPSTQVPPLTIKIDAAPNDENSEPEPVMPTSGDAQPNKERSQSKTGVDRKK